MIFSANLNANAPTWDIGYCEPPQWGECTPTAAVKATLSGTTLTITGTGKMVNYRSSNDIPWNNIRAAFQTVIINDGVTSIGIQMFRNHTNLTSVTIPNSVTHIANMAFEDCTNLTTVTIGTGVTSIGPRAFANCSKLAKVIVQHSIPFSIGRDVFYKINKACCLYAPADWIHVYKIADGWKDFSCIRAIGN